MKKLLTAMSIVLGLGFATAQQVQPAKSGAVPPPPAKSMKAEKHKVEDKVKKVDEKVKKEEKKAKEATKSEGVKLKKDGTPDKRYKGSQHLKKDGTPDMRYKENKK